MRIRSFDDLVPSPSSGRGFVILTCNRLTNHMPDEVDKAGHRNVVKLFNQSHCSFQDHLSY